MASLLEQGDGQTQARARGKDEDQPALPLPLHEEELVDPPMVSERRPAQGRPTRSSASKIDRVMAQADPADRAAVDSSSRALALSDYVAPSQGLGKRLIRLAYRLGVPSAVIEAPLKRPPSPRVLATVQSPLTGNRKAGMALRSGHLLVLGVKHKLAKVDFASSARQSEGYARMVHGFGWLRDLAASAPREQASPNAERITKAWMEANHTADHGASERGPAFEVGHAAHRLLAWLVHAPLVLSGGDRALRRRLLGEIEATARMLDRKTPRCRDGLDAVAGWCAITAAGLLLPAGKARRIYGEAGLIRALGEMVAVDGGVLSRSPLAQIEAIGLLIDLRACYAAVRRDMPEALGVMLELLVPPLLALRHGDGGLGSWQGAGAVSARTVEGLIAASGVRARPLKNTLDWGYHRLRAGKTTVQFDAAPPPAARHARQGCASTLAFEMSDGPFRLVVNCGGAALAGGLVPARIEQGLRATAAHSTLVLDNVNSTSVLLGGKLGKGVSTVEVDRREIVGANNRPVATHIEASHDGYAARFGLIHGRSLVLAADGRQLRGEDVLRPQARRGKRGKIGFAIRFHLGPEVEARVSEDGKGATLYLPDGSAWQFRQGGAMALAIEDSLWVDGNARPHTTRQLVIEGMVPRSGGRFSWIFKKMG